MKNKKGITLIALVITIVVMLIIAGVSFRFVIGENGIINKAKEAKMAMINDIEKDKVSLENLEYNIETHLMEPLERISLDELEDDDTNQELQKLILTVNITEDNKTINLPTYYYANSSDYNCTVNWGDGVETPVNGTNFRTVTHTYSDNHEYDIKISGFFKKIHINSEDSISNVLIKVKQWGKTELKEIDINNCTNLNEIATLSRNSFNQLESVHFFNCTELINIPEELFANCLNVEGFVCTFEDCSNLTGMSIHLWSEGRNGITPTSGGDACYKGCENLEDYGQIPVYWKRRNLG